MRRMMISFTAIVLLVIIGCSSDGSGGGGPKTAAYNSVYGVNALSTDENISLHVGDEVIEPVTPYDQNASIIEKAIGSNNIAYYTVTGGNDLGHTSLQSSRTYFYAATNCNDSSGRVEKLFHLVENDTQINIVNTSSEILLKVDVNITVDGVQVNSADTEACAVTAVAESSAIDQNITVSFSGGESISRILPSDANTSVDVIIYGTPPQEAAIIPLPRLTPDAL